MSNVNNNKVTEYVNALNGKYENKVANKKDDVSGDYSSDTASYPTVRAMKAQDALKVNITDIKDNLTSTDTDKPLSANQGKVLDGAKVNYTDVKDNLTSTDTNKPLSAKMGKKLADEKINYTDVKDNLTSTDTNKPLSAKMGKKLADEKMDITAGTVTVEKQTTAETGYAATYVVKQGGTPVGVKINLIKDKMLRSVTYHTVGSTPTQEESDAGLTTGDKYLLFVMNTADNDDGTRLILPITDFFDLQSADETTITLSQAGVYSIKSGTIEAVIDDYLTAIINAL